MKESNQKDNTMGIFGTILLNLIVIALSVLVLSGEAFADAPSAVNFQGRLFQADGSTPVSSATVTFTLQVFSPDASCLLFEETHFRDMSASNGLFSLVIGQGTNTNASPLALPLIFDNLNLKVGAAGCNYLPANNDPRRLRVSYTDGIQTVSLPVDQFLQSVPYAFEASTLGGMKSSQFIQVNGTTTQAKIDGLLSGTGGLLVPDVPASPQSAVDKNYSDQNFGGHALNMAGLAGGDTVIWNAGTSQWVASTAVTSITAGAGLSGGTITASGTISMPNVGTAGSYTKVTTDAQGRVSGGGNLQPSDIATALGYTALNKSGDTFTGDVNFGAHNVLNTGYITMAPDHYLELGSFDSANESNLVVNTLTPGGLNFAGVTWYNAVTHSMRMWDGTQVVDIASGGSVAGNKSSVGTLNNTTDIGKIMVWSGQVNGWQMATMNAGTVTSVAATAPLSVTNATSTPTLSLQSGTVAGQSLQWSGLAWAPAYSNASYLRSGLGIQQFPTNCTVGQTLSYSAVSDTYLCATISIASTQVTGLGTAATLNVGIGANQVVQLDTNGKLPAVDGSALTNVASSLMSNMQVFDASGTFNIPANVNRVYVQVWGAGGGGGGGNILLGNGGNGGGGGAYAAGLYAVTAGGSITVTVGAAGAAGAQGVAGGAGGTTSFGALIAAGGGVGGLTNSMNPTLGGTSTSALNISGGNGLPPYVGIGGNGGNGAGGGGTGAAGAYAGGNTGTAGIAPGGAGGGGYGTLLVSSAGGAGAHGRVVVWY